MHSLSGASEVLSLGWNKVVFLVWKKIKTNCHFVPQWRKQFEEMIIVIFFLFLHSLNCDLNLGPVKCCKKTRKVNRLLWIANLVNWNPTQNRFSIIMQVVKEILMLWLVQDYVIFCMITLREVTWRGTEFQNGCLSFYQCYRESNKHNSRKFSSKEYQRLVQHTFQKLDVNFCSLR